MILNVEVMPAAEFDRWLERAAGEQNAETLGKALFEGVCSKCHFAAPEYAPNIIGNPTLGDPERLRELVTEGRGADARRRARAGRTPSTTALADFVRQFAPPEEPDGS